MSDTEQPKTLDALQAEVGEWGKATFPKSTLDSITQHLAEEFGEFFIECGYRAQIERSIYPARYDLADEEAADILLLLLHYCHRRGVSLHQLAEAKFVECQSRRWDDGSERGYSKHVSGEGEKIQP